jgi:hypothetical protein
MPAAATNPQSISAGASRIRVKFLSKAQPPTKEYGVWLSRFPHGTPTWGRCDFIFDQDCQSYDWLVVYDDLPRRAHDNRPLWDEHLACPRANTLLLTTEPSSIKLYGNGFASQFGWVLTSQEPWALRHPHRIYRQAGLLWFYGNTGRRGSYDGLAAQTQSLPKTRDISTVCSAKQMRHTLHQARYDFTQALKAKIPDMDIFGLGVRPIPDKAEALDAYRYHVAIENHVSPHHWTEKLADPLLAYSLPFYYGPANVAEYIPEESFIPIDIFKFGEAFERISKAIRDREYEKRLPAIREARRRILEEYSTFAQLRRLIEERHTPAAADPAQAGHLLSRHAWRGKHPFEAVVFALSKGLVQARAFCANRNFDPNS